MNKTELTNAVAEKSGLTKADAGKAVDAVIESIKAGVAAGDKITLPGFLSFEVKDQAERVTRNPATGAPLTIPAKKVVKVRVGKNLKDAVAA